MVGTHILSLRRPQAEMVDHTATKRTVRSACSLMNCDSAEAPNFRRIDHSPSYLQPRHFPTISPTASASPRYFGAATMGSMALIVFFRGINVGGHRAFRPSVLAKELGIYDAVNVGAAGTLVVRKPGSRATFLAELRRKLPFEATIAFCDGSDLIRLEMDNPFGTEPPPADVVQFVSILSEAGRRIVSLPIALPEGEEWLVRIIGSKNRLVYGVYRRRMKTIGYLGQIDKLFGAPATTRSWTTILSVLRILKSHKSGK
jgi:uncharacterized protein (DUF1697 family)